MQTQARRHDPPMPARRLGPSGSITARMAAMVSLLVVANLAAWAWAFVVFSSSPVLLGSAVLAWGFGLRHALDADHIAAIDNVTRRLMQENRRPIGVGLFFSLGHSTVVVLATLAILLAQAWFKARSGSFAAWGAVAGTVVSAGFLLMIGGSNLLLLVSLLRRRVEPDRVPGGALSSVLRPLFRRIGSSPGMFWLGLLFGLGFDTATEIGVLSLAATGAGMAASGGHVGWSVMVLPALFAAGMSLVDTLDGIMMLGAYGWALVEPARKRRYNIAITACSVGVAFGVGVAELLGLLFGSGSGLPGWVLALNDHSERVGAIAAAGFAALWVAAVGIRMMQPRDSDCGKR